MNLVQEIAWYVIAFAVCTLMTIAIRNQKTFIDEDEYEGDSK